MASEGHAPGKHHEAVIEVLLVDGANLGFAGSLSLWASLTVCDTIGTSGVYTVPVVFMYDKFFRPGCLAAS